MIRLPWGTPVERERRNRIRIAVYAYAYELRDECLVADSEYDALARTIQPAMPTSRPVLDRFFAEHYTADSGLWIHRHPELAGIINIYERFYIQ